MYRTFDVLYSIEDNYIYYILFTGDRRLLRKHHTVPYTRIIEKTEPTHEHG